MQEIQVYSSTLLDKVLLVLAVGTIFFEPYLPFWNGSSTAFLVFTFIIAYVFFTRFQSFKRIVTSTYSISVIAFALVCILMESIHSYPQYVDIFRFLSMSLNMFCIAVLCRDKKAIDVALYSFILSSAIHSVYMMAGSMSFLNSISAQSFDEASKARIEAFGQFAIHDYLNQVSFFSGLGAILGIIAWYYETSKIKRGFLVAMILLSMIGIFLPSSRTGALIFFISLIIFLFKSNIRIKRWVVPVLFFSALLFFIVPDVVWVRISSVGRISELQEADSRVKMYTAMFNMIQKYMLTGVGCGYYWKHWAVDNGVTSITTIYEPLAPHNAFFQIWIYWGLPAFLSFICLMYIFSRALDKEIADHRQKASLYIFILTIPIVFLFCPNFYHKCFSVGVGMMLAARYWDIFGDNSVPEKNDEDEIISPEIE